MNIKNLFAKPVDRHIEGVIKADDNARLRLEVEEYVLTDEVVRQLQDFLDAYIQDPAETDSRTNGAWISGFFGSGKSHLLKMLALLMENRTIDSTPATKLFLPKCSSNPALEKAVQKAAAIPSRSILFNIDQKATIIGKEDVDALLSVFVKVFDNMCGYYGTLGYIAQFERHLDERGLYEGFKKSFKEIAGLTWEQGREQVILEAQNINRAYAAVSGNDVDDGIPILSKYENQYNMSIEDFADNVYQYIQKQPPHFRLNFFVDEVGQYIAGNVKLMTNLQTIAESLATRCQGRAWILVTAQEDMEQVIGQMKTTSANDFSKIIDRFKFKLKLTSKNAAEVIQKRLLLKTAESRKELETLYRKQQNNFRTLFDFNDGSTQYKNYVNREHFVNAYPFIPYQFELFQQAIQNLSNHNAFEGRHRSVGERSMLAVFQNVARHLSKPSKGSAQKAESVLAPFPLMFDGIKGTLKSQIQQAIATAEKNLGNPFAVQVLKALFLVRYIKGFKASVRNIQILMTDAFDLDMRALRTQVGNALDLLENQTYIHKAGQFYQFLTDEEKDMEEEIKITEIDHTEIGNELAGILFDQVIKLKKIRFEDGRDFPFTRKLDDQKKSREEQLSIHIISPFYAHLEKEETIKAQAWTRDELLVLMPPDERLIRDFSMYLKTRKYIRLNSSLTLTESEKNIMDEKQNREQKRLELIKHRLQDLLREARLFVGGKMVAVKGEPANRITGGFFQLIQRTYINLPMLQGIRYSEEQIREFLDTSMPKTYDEPQQSIMMEIKRSTQSGRCTTLESLCGFFGHKPYGWHLWATICLLAKLWAAGKIEFRTHDGPIESQGEIQKALKNTKGYAGIIITPQVIFTPQQVRNLKRFYSDFFMTPPGTDDAKTLGRHTIKAFVDEKKKLDELVKLVKQKNYPFALLLEEPHETVSQMVHKPYHFFLTGFDGFKERLIHFKEKILDPILRFTNGPGGESYDRISKFHREQQANYAYISGQEHVKLQEILCHSRCFKNNRMRKAAELMTVLKEKTGLRRTQEIERAKKDLLAKFCRLAGRDEFKQLSKEKKEPLKIPFRARFNDLDTQIQISVIRDTPRQFEEEVYPQLLAQLREWTKDDGGFISKNDIPVPFNKSWLEAPEDVNTYIHALKQAMMEEIARGVHIYL